jgi:hypothetical protein
MKPDAGRCLESGLYSRLKDKDEDAAGGSDTATVELTVDPEIFAPDLLNLSGGLDALQVPRVVNA